MSEYVKAEDILKVPLPFWYVADHVYLCTKVEYDPAKSTNIKLFRMAEIHHGKTYSVHSRFMGYDKYEKWHRIELVPQPDVIHLRNLIKKALNENRNTL